MLEVLFLSDKQVRAKLFAHLERTRPVLVSGVRSNAFMRPVPEREPFASVEREFGDLIDQVVVVDEGSVEGMWRDPLGDLADRLYPNDRQRAYAASSGYVLLRNGEPSAVVRKHGKPPDDLWFLQEALYRAGLPVAPPDPARRPGKRARPAAAHRTRPAPEQEAPPREPPKGPRSARPPRTPRGAAPMPAAEPARSPWTVLGIPEGSPLPDAKRAFREQIAQYHPDKVAHLAPEFHALAEKRTREILDAWEAIQAMRNG